MEKTAKNFLRNLSEFGGSRYQQLPQMSNNK